jgi:FSR family fosmidomycin resistance protein-like MFS transporter
MLLLLTSVLFRSSVQFAMIVFLPFYIIKQWGWSEMDTNPVLAFYLITGSIGTILGGHIAQRIGPRRFFLISVVLVSPLTILFITAPYGRWFYIWLGLSSMALMATWSSMLVMGQDIMPDRSAMAAALMVGFSIGSGGLCATLMGVIADHWGVLSVIWITAFLPLVSAFLGYWVPESDKKPTLMTIETKVAP